MQDLLITIKESWTAKLIIVGLAIGYVPIYFLSSAMVTLKAVNG